jgi:3-deoxy-D-manno-octulosonic acid kinase
MRDKERCASMEPVKWHENRFDALFDARYVSQITERQFSPSGYADAQPVSGQGGRGGAWFVETQAGPGVLKQYRRGGLMAKWIHDRYVYAGLENTRAFREFRLLQVLSEKGLPVPMPLAAFCRRGALTYQAALLTKRIPDVRSLITAVRNHTAPWSAIGETIARFHRVGARHGDLNANNILLDADGGIHIIDWDKSALEETPGAWCGQVLDRLQRSLEKECAAQADYRVSGIQALRDAYYRGMA